MEVGVLFPYGAICTCTDLLFLGSGIITQHYPSVLEGTKHDFHLTVQNMSELSQAFSTGDAAAKTAVLAALDERRSFSGAYERHPTHFLQHVLVHDAHHRGQVMGLLRQSGRTAEQMVALEQATWPIWRE